MAVPEVKWRNVGGSRGFWVTVVEGQPLRIDYSPAALDKPPKHYRITTRYSNEMFAHQFYTTLQEAQTEAIRMLKAHLVKRKARLEVEPHSNPGGASEMHPNPSGGETAVVGLGLLGLTVALIAMATRRVERVPPEEEEVVEVIDAELRSGYVFWAGLTEWRQVYTRWPNTWPADTDVTFAWKIRNTGNTGAYFQVYMFDPGEWLYIEPGKEIEVFEEFHTPTLPVTPGYQYYTISILGRKVTGERIGAVWTSDMVEVNYI